MDSVYRNFCRKSLPTGVLLGSLLSLALLLLPSSSSMADDRGADDRGANGREHARSGRISAQRRGGRRVSARRQRGARRRPARSEHVLARPTRVALTVDRGSGGAAVAGDLRRGLIDELGEHSPGLTLTRRRRAQWLLRGSVIRLVGRRRGAAHVVSCEVSLIVSNARGGAIRAMLTGRASASGAEDNAQLRQDALRAAIRGAVGGLDHPGGLIR